jgi:hypothetical protein
MKDGTCVLCADGNFHCNDEVLPPCSPSVYGSKSCAGFLDAAGPGICMACSTGGEGTMWRCLPGYHWLLEPGATCIQ